MYKITKADREEKSRKRQKVSQDMAVWEEKVNFLRNTVNHGVPGAAEKLAFVLKEIETCKEQIRLINRGQMRQRVWGRGKY